MRVFHELAGQLRDARERTLALVADLSDEQLQVPQLDVVNPMLWELGHVAWFQERWTLRHLWHELPRIEHADALFDSIGVAHDSRWHLALPPRERVLRYMQDVLDALVARLSNGDATGEAAWFARLVLFHEDMHGEAFCYTRQTLAYPPPPLSPHDAVADAGAPLGGDVDVSGGTWRLGAEPDALPFVFDNEQWAHPVEVAPFRIARAKVTQVEFAAFVADGGYRRRELWTDAGWNWRTAANAELPIYWRSGDGGFERRHFDRWVALEPHLPVHHVCCHEAEAFCRWAGRRLPTEAEWEMAATLDPAAPPTARKRRWPWGDEPWTRERAVLDGCTIGPAPVDACAAGDSPVGCRQLVGGAWEWTASTFAPYPGFVAGPYAEYSAPWFGTHRVLRGGAWATRARLLRTTWRNFFTPDRRDVIAGFRTAAK